MGRIADALKRAETERRMTGGGPSIATLPDPTEIISAAQPQAIPGLKEPEAWRGTANDEPEKAVEVVQGLSESLIPYYERSSLVTEQYRSLRTRLLSQNPNFEHRTIAITSAAPRP